MSYQKVTGAILASGYNKLGTQEAMNDMYVVENADELFNSKNRPIQGIRTGTHVSREGLQIGNGFNSWGGYDDMKTIVRRLTPLECERLQGFPDGWTDIGEWTDSKGKVHKESSDAARYKALGNSIAVGYANGGSGYWMTLLKRISAQYERNATLGSLFDGIGGFPLAWEHYNGKGSAVWASEIEEFPIAVTKKRFPES